MDYMSCYKLLPLASLLLLLHVKGTLEQRYVCDYDRNNGRPVSVPLEEYAKYCCEADKFEGGHSISRFSCSDKGGCCGETDAQYCCDRYKIDCVLALQLGLGISGGILFLVISIVWFICCLAKGSCCFCCKRSRPPPPSFWNAQSRDVLDVLRSRESSPSSAAYYTQQNTRTTRHQPAPTAPPISEPTREPDMFPPSYDDVVQNPRLYPETTASKV